MNVLNRLTLKHLKLNKKRTIVTIIGIILSASLMVGIGTIASSMREYFIDTMEANSGKQHATILEVPYKNVKYIAKNSNVFDYYLHYALGYARLEGGKNEYKPYLYIESANTSYLETSTLVDGRLPENNQEIVIPRHVKDNGQVEYHIGDQLTLDLGERYLLDETDPLWQNNPYDKEETFSVKRTVTYTIVGIIERRYDENYSSPGYTVLTKAVEGEVDEETLIPVSILYKKIKDVHQKTEKIAETVGAPTYTYADGNGKETTLAMIDYNERLLSFYGESSFDSITSTLTAVIVIVLCLVSIGCALVIYNSFAISVMERKKQFGLMSSIGATKKQIRKTVLFEALIVGVIGIPLGVLGGIFGIWCVIQVINHFLPGIFEFPLTLSLYPLFLILPIVYMIITILISAFLPARKASKISPIEAIRLNDDIKIKAKKIKTSRMTNRFYGIEGELAFKNMKRNKKKYRITILSLIVSIVLFIGFSTFLEYGKQSTEGMMDLSDYDLQIYHYSSTNSDEFAHKLIEQVTSVSGIDQYLGLLPPFSDLEFSLTYKISDMSLTKEYRDYFEREGKQLGKEEKEEQSLPIIALDSISYQNYLKKLGFKATDYEGSALKVIFANSFRYRDCQSQIYQDIQFSKHQGTKNIPLQFSTRSNSYRSNEDGIPEESDKKNEVSVPITFVMDAPDLYGKSLVAVISEEMIPTLRSQFPEVFDETRNEFYATSVLVKAKNYNQVEEALEKILPEDARISNYSKSMQADRNIIILVSILLYGFISLVTLIGVTSVFNTITTSIALRRKEFAVLRSIGLSPKGFNRMIRFESLLYGFKALLWGLPLSFIVVVLFNQAFGNIRSSQSLLIPWNAIILCAIEVFVITFLTMIYSTRKIKQENILDAIREENI